MIDLYQQILQDTRSPERTEAAMSLVDVLYDTGYDTELDAIIGLVSMHDSAQEVVGPAEWHISHSTESLLNRLGIIIDVTDIHQHYRDMYLLLIAVLEDVEQFDDYASMHSIIDSGEPNEIILVNLIAFLHPDVITALDEIIKRVDDKLIRIMRSVLMARAANDESNTDNYIDRATALRVAAFIRAYPDNLVSEILDDNGYLLPERVLMETVDIDPEQTTNYAEAVALCAAGIAVAKNDTHREAYESIEGLVDMLIDDRYHNSKLIICNAAMDALVPIYEKAGDEDE